MQQRLDLGFQFLDLLPAGIDTLQAIGQFLAALCQLLAQHLGILFGRLDPLPLFVQF